MRFKSDTSYHLIIFFNGESPVPRQNNTCIFCDGEFLPQIQQVRSDNGSECLSKEMQHFFSEMCYSSKKSCIYTSTKWRCRTETPTSFGSC